MKKLTYQTVCKASFFTLFVPLLLISSIALADEGTSLTSEIPAEETVKQKAVEPTTVHVSVSSLTINRNETQQIQATVSPANAENQQVSWSSTNEQVVKVTNGLVEGVKVGTTTVTARTANGVEESIPVTVVDPAVELKDTSSNIRVSGVASVLPKETTLKVKTSKQGTEIYNQVKKAVKGNFLLVDIQLLNKAGETIQPNGKVKVQVPVPKAYHQEKVKMYTYDAKNNNLTEIKGSIEADMYTFETTHFSYYVLVEEVDVQALTKTIKKATALLPDEYTKESWEALTNMLAVAQDALANAQEQTIIDQATSDLDEAIANLEAKPIKQALNQAVSNAQKLKKADYEATSWQIFQEKLIQAQTVLEKDDATKEAIDTALKQLQSAQNNLKVKDSKKLATAIENAENLVKAEYTEKTWAIVEAELKNAKNLAADENATQKAIDQATNSLNTAIKKLEKNKKTPSTVASNKLAEAIKKAETLAEEHYTGETWKIFSEKLAAAKKVVADVSATQQEIDTALSDLTQAQKALIAKVDKEALGELIDQALKLNATDFEAKTWDNFKKSLEEAQTVFGNAKATVNEIAESFKKLKADIAALKSARNKSTSNNVAKPTSTSRKTNSFSLPKRTNKTYPASHRKTSFLPRTGEQFSDYLPIMGGGLVLVGVIIFIRRRKAKTN